MRYLVMICALATLAACSEHSSRATFTCPNGPDLVVTYAEEGATLVFPSGRVELLPRPDPERPEFYAKPGMVWDAARFREARLTDGEDTYRCDQMAG